MKKIFLPLLLNGLGLTAFSQEPKYLFSYFKDNGQDGLHLAYSADGLHWKALNHDRPVLSPEVGKDRLMRDPCIIRGGDGQFHMVWTTGWKDRYIGYAQSKDLVHWTAQRLIPVMETEAAARNAWAPEITWDETSKQYMIYWSTTIPGRFSNVGSEDNYNHRVYYTVTKDFKTFSKTALLFDPGFNVIDATIVRDGNQFRMFFKDETLVPPQKNLRMAVADHLTGPYQVSEQVLTGKYWAEGPTTLRQDGRWTVYFDKYQLGRYGAVRSEDLREWTDVSDSIEMPDKMRHGSVLRISAEEWERLSEAFGQ